MTRRNHPCGDHHPFAISLEDEYSYAPPTVPRAQRSEITGNVVMTRLVPRGGREVKKDACVKVIF